MVIPPLNSQVCSVMWFISYIFCSNLRRVSFLLSQEGQITGRLCVETILWCYLPLKSVLPGYRRLLSNAASSQTDVSVQWKVQMDTQLHTYRCHTNTMSWRSCCMLPPWALRIWEGEHTLTSCEAALWHSLWLFTTSTNYLCPIFCLHT